MCVNNCVRGRPPNTPLYEENKVIIELKEKIRYTTRKKKGGEKMAYVFNRETASTFKIPAGSTDSGKSLSLKGINSQTTSADSIVAGIQGLFYIANSQNKYDYEEGIRVVNEDVDSDE